MLKRTFLIATILFLAVLGANPWPVNGGEAAASGLPESSTSMQANDVNILPNGNLDQGAFYFRPTNHYVASQWFEWWVDPNLPEFIDGRSHYICYPPPSAGRTCYDDKNKSQGYIRWGAPYIAGIYQPVQVTACAYYRFEAYNRNDGNYYNPKVGIDPTGWQLPIKGERPPNNCPPDGASICPDPSLSSVNDLPSTLVWSPPFDHAAYTWASQSVTAEALSNTITVWTYAAPDQAGSLSTYWDYMSLVQAPPPSGKLITGVTLPAPDGLITNVTTQTTALRATLNWKTGQPALSQVLYHYVGEANMPAPPPITTTVSAYESASDISYTPSTDHSMRLPNLRPMSLYDYVILARRLVGNNCQTSVYTGRLSTTDMLVPQGALPAPSSDIIGLTVLPFEHSAYVIWQSAESSYAQVLYHYAGPITPTIPPTMTQQVFLPIVSVASFQDSTSNYEFRTVPITTFTTLHIVQLTGLQPDSNYTAVAISAWTEGDLDQVAVSDRASFRTAYVPTLAVEELSPLRLAEQLQACLPTKSLEVCVSQVAASPR